MSASSEHPKAFEMLPAFLNLSGRRVLIVGGGAVACSKLQSLRSTGAAITLVAPQIDRNAVLSGIRVHRRNFRESDLDGVWFVVSAATSHVNSIVARAANRRHIFVNAVDDPASASAYFGGTVRRGSVTLAISSAGRAPALVRLLREALEQVLPQDVSRWLEVAEAERAQWKKNDIPMSARAPLLVEAIRNLYPQT